MTTFAVTPEGWIDLGTPSPETIAWAEERRADHDRQAESTDGVTWDHRLRGDIGERAAAAWIRSCGECQWNGGVNDLPDIVIGGRCSIDVVTRGVNVAPSSRFSVDHYPVAAGGGRLDRRGTAISRQN